MGYNVKNAREWKERIEYYGLLFNERQNIQV